MTRFFTIPRTGDWYASFTKPFRILVKKLFFNNVSALQPANAIKTVI